MSLLTLDVLHAVMPTLDKPKADLCYPPLAAALDEFEINTPYRIAAFLAQIAHESGELKWFRELWGPTPQQLKYEPPSRLAKELGNTRKGDGKRYKGRGVIQLTGRANYSHIGDLLGLPLEEKPELAEQPDVAFRVAGLFWKTKGLNALADGNMFQAITKRINGGYNGMDGRLKYYQRARVALGIDRGDSIYE